MTALPIDDVVPKVVDAAVRRGALVLEAPPGAGKTTRVPPALLDALGESGDVIVLEPRRIAARLAARRVADERGERVGDTVGYTVRFEDVSSRATRLRFVTEGVLARRLVSDPTLAGTRAVVLDEFHERNLQGDLALALVRRLRAEARPGLIVVVMSATLDTAPVSEFLRAETLRCEGRMFDVSVEYATAMLDRPLELQVAAAVRDALRGAAPGDVLVFLPGAREIRLAEAACAKLAAEADAVVLPLHGDLPPREQDRAVLPHPKRKIILSTNVAESSITIDGVVTVVDSGLARVAGYAPWSGLPTLEVQKVSRASAEQRSGRAGRTRPGRCIRLYTQADFLTRRHHEVPEVQRADLAHTWLELCAARRTDVVWLDPPPESAVRSAISLLSRLSAIDDHGALTAIGRRLLAHPVHPRQGRVLLEAVDRGARDDGAVLAALLGERDIRSERRTALGGPRGVRDAATERSDVLAALDLFREAEGAGFSPDALRRVGLTQAATVAVKRTAERLVAREAPKAAERSAPNDEVLLKALLAGYPDRVVRRLTGRRLAVAGGGSQELSEDSVVRDAPWMVAVDATVRAGRVVVRTASAIEPEWLIEMFPEHIRETLETEWNASAERVVTLSKMVYDGLVMAESESATPSAEASRVLFAAARARGARAFVAEGSLERWLARARFAAAHDARVRAATDGDVEGCLERVCEGRRSFAELRDGALLAALDEWCGAQTRELVATIAPDRVTLARGRSVAVEYEPDKSPWIASRLQDFFGMDRGPALARGKVPLVLHLLAPNQRAVQVTSDLEGFWMRHYPSIKKELARRYPKHAWPDDPRRPGPESSPRRR